MSKNRFLFNKYVLVMAVSGTLAVPLPVLSNDKGPLVEQLCASCHSLTNLERSAGYSQQDWQTLISYMVDAGVDTALNKDISAYLAEHYPVNTKRESKVVAGDLKLSFKYWQVPTLGQRARDPVQGKNGIIWWVGQWGNILGRLDPQTGDMKEYTLPSGTYAHSVSLDKSQTPWFLGNKNGTVGYLDLKTEKFKVYKMPNKNARDPHTGVFDEAGIFWFTLQHSNMIGKLDPTTGDIQLATLPTKGSRPYGIKLDSKGTPWVSCNGSNCLVKVDKNTMELSEIKLPGAKTHTRRLAITPDDIVFYVNSGMGKLGRYNPKNGKITQWDNPSGENSHPYAIEYADNAIWFNESAKRPETLVRFDLNTETMQSWQIPSKEGVYSGLIRHMRMGNNGLIIHQTATNQLAEITWSK
ncbi:MULTISPECIES: cytochrome C [Pseudoalteromonas]|jgi:virginiamycin B lyase|uniref:Vgb family protein n=1 Tax=Pseudoalteromonas TaxID=53246 RepID=UPI001195D072|nr:MULTISPECIES: cytochrome C [Pseudoalteromonas]TVU75959.1 cytochrome C [Pseudoalteromonas elyakovii]|tara:strand:- start:660 stop:1892 length:1233 start_codon:yes stop_codon:yes gene_type:complete